MKGKNLQAVARGSVYMLARFANLPVPGMTLTPNVRGHFVGTESEALRAIDAFRNEFGDLYPGMGPRDWFGYILNFRIHWQWNKGTSEKEIRKPLRVSLRLDKVETLDVNELDCASAFATGIAAATEVNFSSGHVQTTPKTLLDWLMLSLIRCRRNLAFCKCEGCESPYFVKARSGSKYCSEKCTARAKQRSKERYEHENRGRHAKANRLRRKLSKS